MRGGFEEERRSKIFAKWLNFKFERSFKPRWRRGPVSTRRTRRCSNGDCDLRDCLSLSRLALHWALSPACWSPERLRSCAARECSGETLPIRPNAQVREPPTDVV